jgi:hypothetical protein
MNLVVIKYKNGSEKEVKTKLTDTDKIIKFLELTGDWNDDVDSFELVENVNSASCNYQNMDSETD